MGQGLRGAGQVGWSGSVWRWCEWVLGREKGERERFDELDEFDGASAVTYLRTYIYLGWGRVWGDLYQGFDT